MEEIIIEDGKDFTETVNKLNFLIKERQETIANEYQQKHSPSVLTLTKEMQMELESALKYDPIIKDAQRLLVKLYSARIPKIIIKGTNVLRMGG